MSSARSSGSSPSASSGGRHGDNQSAAKDPRQDSLERRRAKEQRDPRRHAKKAASLEKELACLGGEHKAEELRRLLGEERQSSRRTVARLQRQIARLKSERSLAHPRESGEGLHQELEGERELRQAAEKRLQEMKMESDSCRARLQALQHDFKQMEETVRGMIQYKSKLEQVKQEKSSLSSTYESTLQKYRSHLAELERENMVLLNQVKKLESQLNESGEGMGGMEEERGASKARLLAERLRRLEAENSELVLETEAQRQQYEKCLDQIANQVVQALLAQKTLREECLKLQGRVRDLELQNQHLNLLFQQRFHGSSDVLLQLLPARSGGGEGGSQSGLAECPQHPAPHASHLVPHASHLVPHASHLVPHASHLVPHASHLVPQALLPAPHFLHPAPSTVEDGDMLAVNSGGVTEPLFGDIYSGDINSVIHAPPDKTTALCVETEFPDSSASQRLRSCIPVLPRERIRSYSPPLCPSSAPLRPPRKCHTLGHRSGVRQLPQLSQQYSFPPASPKSDPSLTPGHGAALTGGDMHAAVVTGGDMHAAVISGSTVHDATASMDRVSADVPHVEPSAMGATPLRGRQVPVPVSPASKPARARQRTAPPLSEQSRQAALTPPPLPPRSAVKSPPSGLGLVRTNSSPASPACRSQYYYDYSDEDSDARPVSRDMSTASSLSLNELLDSSFDGDNVPESSLDDEFFSDWSTMCLSPQHRVRQPGTAPSQPASQPGPQSQTPSQPGAQDSPAAEPCHENVSSETEIKSAVCTRLQQLASREVPRSVHSGEGVGWCGDGTAGAARQTGLASAVQDGVEGAGAPTPASQRGEELSPQTPVVASTVSTSVSVRRLLPQPSQASAGLVSVPEPESSRLREDNGSRRQVRAPPAGSALPTQCSPGGTAAASLPCGLPAADSSRYKGEYVTLQYRPPCPPSSQPSPASACVQQPGSVESASVPSDVTKSPSSSGLPGATQQSPASSGSLPSEPDPLKSASSQPKLNDLSAGPQASPGEGLSKKGASLSKAPGSSLPQSLRKRPGSSTPSPSSIPKPSASAVHLPKSKQGASTSSPQLPRSRLNSVPASNQNSPVKLAASQSKGPGSCITSYRKPTSPLSPPASPLKTRSSAAARHSVNSPKLPAKTQFREQEQQKKNSKKLCDPDAREQSPSTTSLDKVGTSPSRLPKFGKGKNSKFDSWPGRLKSEPNDVKRSDTISGYSYCGSVPQNQHALNGDCGNLQSKADVPELLCGSPPAGEKAWTDQSPVQEKPDKASAAKPAPAAPYTHVVVVSSDQHQGSPRNSCSSEQVQRSRPENLILAPKEKTFSYAGFSSASSSSAEEPKSFPREATFQLKVDNSAVTPHEAGEQNVSQGNAQNDVRKTRGISTPSSPRKIPPPVPVKPGKSQREGSKGKLVSSPPAEVQLTVQMCTGVERFPRLPQDIFPPSSKSSLVATALSQTALPGESGSVEGKLEHDLSKTELGKEQILKHSEGFDAGRKTGKTGNISRYFSGYEGGLCLRTASDLAGRTGRQVVSPVGRSHSTDSSLENLRAGEQGEYAERSGSRDDGYSTMSSDVVPESLERYADPAPEVALAGSGALRADHGEESVDSALETSAHSVELQTSSQSLSSQTSASSSPDFSSALASPTTVISPSPTSLVSPSSTTVVSPTSKVRQMRQFFEEECQRSGTGAGCPAPSSAPCRCSPSSSHDALPARTNASAGDAALPSACLSVARDSDHQEDLSCSAASASSHVSCGDHSPQISHSISSGSFSCTDPSSPYSSPASPSKSGLVEPSCVQKSLTKNAIDTSALGSSEAQGGKYGHVHDKLGCGSNSRSVKQEDSFPRMDSAILDSSGSSSSQQLPVSDESSRDSRSECPGSSRAPSAISSLLQDIVQRSACSLGYFLEPGSQASAQGESDSDSECSDSLPLLVLSAGSDPDEDSSSEQSVALLHISEKLLADIPEEDGVEEWEAATSQPVPPPRPRPAPVLAPSAPRGGARKPSRAAGASSLVRRKSASDTDLALHKRESEEEAYAHMEDGHLNSGVVLERSASFSALRSALASGSLGRNSFRRGAVLRLDELELMKRAEALVSSQLARQLQAAVAVGGSDSEEEEEEEGHIDFVALWQQRQQRPQSLPPWQPQKTVQALRQGATPSPVRVGRLHAGRPEDWLLQFAPEEIDQHLRGGNPCSRPGHRLEVAAEEGGRGSGLAGSGRLSPADGSPRSPRAEQKNFRSEFYSLCSMDSSHKQQGAEGASREDVAPLGSACKTVSEFHANAAAAAAGTGDWEGLPPTLAPSAKFDFDPVSLSFSVPALKPDQCRDVSTPPTSAPLSSPQSSVHCVSSGPSAAWCLSGGGEEGVERGELERMSLQMASLSRRVTDLQCSLSSLSSEDSAPLSQLDLCSALPGGLPSHSLEAGADDYHWEDDGLDLSTYGEEAESGQSDLFEGDSFPSWLHEAGDLDSGDALCAREQPAVDASQHPSSTPGHFPRRDVLCSNQSVQTQLLHSHPAEPLRHSRSHTDEDASLYRCRFDHSPDLGSSRRVLEAEGEVREKLSAAGTVGQADLDALRGHDGHTGSELQRDGHPLDNPEVRASLLDGMVASCGESNDSLASDIGLDHMMCQRLMGPSKGRPFAVRGPTGPPARPALDFSKFFIRYSQPEREAVAAFDFLDNISTASESEHVAADAGRQGDAHGGGRVGQTAEEEGRRAGEAGKQVDVWGLEGGRDANLERVERGGGTGAPGGEVEGGSREARSSPKQRRLEKSRQRRRTKQRRRQLEGKLAPPSPRLPPSTWSGGRGAGTQPGLALRGHYTSSSEEDLSTL